MLKRLYGGVLLILALISFPIATPIYWVITGKSWMDLLNDLANKLD